MKTSVTKAKNVNSSDEELKKKAFEELKNTIQKNLPKGFEAGVQFGMDSYFVPHSLYPDGYHCQPNVALPFISVAMQKNFIAVYHMGIYADPLLMDWFVKEYAKTTAGKLDMGKSCIRFKKPNDIPFELMGKLAKKMTVKDWIALYVKNYKKKK
jgi:hypothetical protein